MYWEYLLSFFYFYLAFRNLQKWSFFKNSGLSLRQLKLLLGIKIACSVFATYYFIHSNTNDYLNFNDEGFLQYKILNAKPFYFFNDFATDIKNYGWSGIFSSSHSFWANLRFNFIYKFIAIINLISHGNFYLNSMIFSSLVFVGNVSFFIIFYSIYQNQKFKIILVCFLIPSMLLYTSCIHKDGIVFICLSIISYLLYTLNNKQILNLKYLFFIFLFISVLFILRNHVVLALIPSITLSLLYRFLKTKKLIKLLLIYLVMITVCFMVQVTDSNLAQIMINRKSDFQLISKGNTDIILNDLKPNITSFLFNLPQALNHSFLRPYLFEFKSISVNLTAVEILMYEFLIILFFFYRKRKSVNIHWFNVFGISMILHLFLIIGYTIPNIGAIVRYRSIYWIFLITPVLCNIDPKKMNWLPTFFKR